MKTKTIGVGLLLVGAGALAEDARSWAVGELLNAIKPAGGWNLAGIVSMPWGSIIGVPVFLIAALWLLWDAFGRASFRARFGAERVLAEHVAPLKARFEFNYAHIQNIYTALGALRDRERLKESREKLEITERSIWQLTALPEINDSLAFTLTSFEAEWTDELNYWVSIAQAYDEGIGTRINTLSEEQRKEPLPFNAEGLESGTILSFIAWRALCENWRAHAETIEGIVEDAAFRGETPFKQESRQLRLLPSVFHVF